MRRVDTEIGKYHLLQPMIDVAAIGAGGGSIARVEPGGYLRVGPASAGASPGPAGYGARGTAPTVTDADLLLGILDPTNFRGGRITLDPEGGARAIATDIAEPLGISIEAAAAGIKRIVDGRMADLLRMVTLERGHDPRDFVLYAFGGAGPAHASAFALDVVATMLVPVTRSVHSALGAASSDVALTSELAVPMRLAVDSSAATRKPPSSTPSSPGSSAAPTTPCSPSGSSPGTTSSSAPSRPAASARPRRCRCPITARRRD